MSNSKFKKNLLCLTLVLSISGWLCPNLQVSAASAAHTHEWGSHEWVESVIFVDRSVDLFTYKENGHTFVIREVTEWCRFFRECYCGERGMYREGGRTRTIRVLID